MRKSRKIILGIISSGLIIWGGFYGLYIKGLPYLVSHPKTIEFVQNNAKKYINADLIIEKPVLKTHFSPKFSFKANKIYFVKDDKKLIDITNFNFAMSFEKIFSKTIVIEKLTAEKIYVDLTDLEKLIPKQNNKKENKNDWNIDILDALLGVKDCEIIYLMKPDIKIHLKGHHIGVNNANKIKRDLYFQLLADISRRDKHVTLSINDNRKVFFAQKHFYVQDCPLSINKSNIFIDLIADKKQNLDINLYSKNLNINDIIDFLNTQIIENNVQKDVLSYFSDINGNLDFNLNIKNDKLNGNFKINKSQFKIKDINNIPITITKGNIDLTPDKVTLIGFEGYYDNEVKNKIDFEGSVKDYFKSIDTDITGNALVRNDFVKKHLSKMSGTPLEIKGEAPTRIMFKSKNNVMDIVWLFMLKPGQNIKVANDYLPFEDTLRLMKSDMHFENMVLDIKELNYHMIPKDKILDKKEMEEKRKEGKKPTPIFTINGSIDVKNNNYIKYIGFEIPKPLPSEFLNAVLKQQLFKKGQIGGKLLIDNRGKYPALKGSLTMDKVLVPSQMMFIKEAVMEAKDNIIHINSKGGYRRAKFTFNGDILNEIKFPIIVKNVNFSLENIDLLKLLEAFNNQESMEDVIVTDNEVIKTDNQTDEFDIRSLIVEKCRFHLDKGSYKEIEFGNLDADLTLNKEGVIDIKSNKFDFAKGHSSLKANFDLINKKYNVKLGISKADSDVIASSLLDLKNEISGLASGFMDLSTDETMKLNGTIKFRVLNGTIGKIGLVEYVLKCASILRNTVSMINPVIVADIVNIPNGEFEKITGSLNLKNNVVTGIKIKTFAPQLSNYIAGRYNIENGDTSLRVYTKFSGVNKGFLGILRKISLNALANRIPMNSRNDENYYAVELNELPPINASEKDCQIFVTKVEGDVVNNNYISSLKKIK